MQNQVKDRLGLLQREINFREKEIAKMTTEINEKEGQMTSATIASQLNGQAKSELENKVVAKDVQIKKLQEELDNTSRSLDTVVMTRKAEGTAQL